MDSRHVAGTDCLDCVTETLRLRVSSEDRVTKIVCRFKIESYVHHRNWRISSIETLNLRAISCLPALAVSLFISLLVSLLVSLVISFSLFMRSITISWTAFSRQNYYSSTNRSNKKKLYTKGIVCFRKSTRIV